MEVDLVVTAVEVTEGVTEIHPDQEANLPGGKSYPQASTPRPSTHLDGAKGRPMPDYWQFPISISFSSTLMRLIDLSYSAGTIDFLSRSICTRQVSDGID
jgi:hypothetical protein